MIDNIKSSYFIKIIFSLIDEKRKLKLIKYNKNMKNKLEVQIQLIINFLVVNMLFLSQMEKKKNLIMKMNQYLKENI